MHHRSSNKGEGMLAKLECIAVLYLKAVGFKVFRWEEVAKHGDSLA